MKAMMKFSLLLLLLLSEGERLLPRRRLPLRRKMLRLRKRSKRRPRQGPELAAAVPAKLD